MGGVNGFKFVESEKYSGSRQIKTKSISGSVAKQQTIVFNCEHEQSSAH